MQITFMNYLMSLVHARHVRTHPPETEIIPHKILTNSTDFSPCVIDINVVSMGSESRIHEVFVDGEDSRLFTLMTSDTERSHNVALCAQQPSLD